MIVPSKCYLNRRKTEKDKEMIEILEKYEELEEEKKIRFDFRNHS